MPNLNSYLHKREHDRGHSLDSSAAVRPRPTECVRPSHPRVKLLAGENVREGFVNRPEFDVLCEHLDDDNRDLVKFLYLSAWRSGEAKSLEWNKVDLNDGVIQLSRKNEKTKRPRTLALVGELREIIDRREAKPCPSASLSFIVAASRSSHSAARSSPLRLRWGWVGW